MGRGLSRLGAQTLQLNGPWPAGARLLFSAAALLAVLSAVRLGEYRALSAPDVAIDAVERPTLVWLFQPEDCRRYQGLVRRWNDLAARGNVDVLGIGIGFPSTTSARDSLFGEVRPTFPVRYDLGRAADRLLARAGRRRTPTSVLLDPEGKPLLILPPVSDAGVQRAAGRIIEEYARQVARAAG
jgi:hypothetical protein